MATHPWAYPLTPNYYPPISSRGAQILETARHGIGLRTYPLTLSLSEGEVRESALLPGVGALPSRL